MNNSKRIVIIGATSAMAEQCARIWIQNKETQLVLVGRSAEKLNRVANDLTVRNPNAVIEILESNLIDAAAIQATVKQITAASTVDIALICHGSLPDQQECQNDLNACQTAIEVNALSPVLFAEAFAQAMAKQQHGSIALIGSVAGDRGRKSNYVYGAAKGLVTRYTQGLQHRFANTNIKIILVKPGPTDTPMTAHLKATGAKLASSEQVARNIVKGIEIGRAVIYTPVRWALIMMIIRHLPSFIFKRMDI